MRQRLDARWKAQLAQLRNLRRQRTNRRGGLAAFAVQIDAEAPDARDAIRRIGNLPRAILLQRMRCESRQHNRFDLRAVQRLGLNILHAAFV